MGLASLVIYGIVFPTLVVKYQRFKYCLRNDHIFLNVLLRGASELSKTHTTPRILTTYIKTVWNNIKLSFPLLPSKVGISVKGDQINLIVTKHILCEIQKSR